MQKSLNVVWQSQKGDHVIQLVVPYNPQLAIDDVMEALFEFQQDLLANKKAQEAAVKAQQEAAAVTPEVVAN
jgi:hypothetical protein